MDRDNFRGLLFGALTGTAAVTTIGDDVATLVIATIEGLVAHPLSTKVVSAINGLIGVGVTCTVQTLVAHYTGRKIWTEEERKAMGDKSSTGK